MKKSLLSLLTIAALVLAPACCWDRCDKPCNPRPACPKKQSCPKPCKPCKKRCKPMNECNEKSSNGNNGYQAKNSTKKSTRKVAARKPRASKKA